ncbi:uncharacterized protein [Miscanthus floridulus]|uniref:uncharacterized protein n=1 Tax=Miscanthus floridulus TaxID=154761 RepID=UPI0034585610
MQGEMVVAVASPSSAAPAPSAGRLHPTYKEMIMQALTELRDPGGSSRSAIANYIADHFSGLHSRHDALLSVHLRSLRSHGQLRLVSGNYFVSTATQQPAPGQKRGRGRPRKNPDLAPSALIPAFQGPKRGRGRPRKNALDPVASSPSPLQGASAPPPPSGVKRGRGRPRKDALAPPPSSSSPLLGAIDPPPPSVVKRGRGRPRKSALVPVRSSFSQLLKAIAPPPPSGVKRGRGRPRKNAYPAVAPLVGVEQGPSGGQPQRNTVPLSPPPATMPHSGESKPVRPLRVAVDVNALRGSSMNISACSNTVVGGKEKMQPESVQSADASLTKRGRGRPRKEKALKTSHLKAAQMTEGQHEALAAQAADQAGAVQNEVEAKDLQSLGTSLTEKKMTEGQQEALTAQAADQAGAVQNEVEARDLQSLGTSLTEKRGRRRPRKRPLETKTSEAGVAASAVKRGRGRPRKEKTLETGNLKVAQMTEGRHEALPAQAVDQTGPMENEVEARILQSLGTSLTEKITEGQQEALTAQAADQAGSVQNEVEAWDLQSLGTSFTEKRGRGRPRKRPLETETTEEVVPASTVKRGRGRPRKEKTLETGDLKVAQMTEGQHEALPAQAVDQGGPMQNEVEARILQSFGTPLMEKRGRGRPRKKPLETETAETQGDALVKKRRRGRPRKARPFETGSAETAVEVSRDLTEDGPEKDGDLVSGKKAEAQGVLLVEGIDNCPADAGCLVVSREEVPIAPMDAGGVLLSGEEASIAPMDAGRATTRVDPMDVGTKSH